ncbi:hypothetical protein HELRODRAFT_62089 [Helobdella robusta]|uniref:Uncharacterized protein n=1 Tax=Helobdella robusta TaxID=6412 RepID=T1FWV5_HELRO|nr:hypothetical protein HELRODRAFT_62089 [Helobdella robusta]ESO12902.1 hypothetical protein HELRODRAFT_62089 [Helobdella robusta]
MKNSEFYKWNLDFTTKVLADKFPFSFIWTIKPSEMEVGTYGVYKNFVESTNYGIPLHYANQKSWVHLCHLLKSAIKNLSDGKLLDHGTCYKYESIIDLPLILIGFSKGCIVLNQLLYDWDGEVNSCDALQLFMNKMKKIYWLDGGHAGSSCFWVTDTVILKHLVLKNIQLEIHVTPFQIMNRHKPVVAKEYKIFLRILNDLKANITSKVHFENQEPSIENHFSLLLSFV